MKGAEAKGHRCPRAFAKKTYCTIKKGGEIMSKCKVSQSILSVIAVFSTYIAVVSSSTCFPFLAYTPKAPESLIKTE